MFFIYSTKKLNVSKLILMFKFKQTNKSKLGTVAWVANFLVSFPLSKENSFR
jgi:hypothetical protein